METMLAINTTLPTLYEHYTAGGITSGLSADQSYFTLNDKNITIYSGAMHYFRIPKEYWRDRLRKMRAAGLNAVETYIPWNLHEFQNGHFDFGRGGSEMEEFLDVQNFLVTAQEEDLLAIIRPGPFICSEWEFGGFPSWLLREKNIKVRTSDPVYMKYVKRYFNILLSLLTIFQFTKGGPIIAFQVENEYGSTEKKGVFKPDKLYLQQLRQLFLDNGIVELLVTSDSPTSHGSVGTLPGLLLQTANFASNPEKEFDRLKQLQRDKPTMAMEFWTGWFDHWSELHHTRNDDEFYNIYERILKYPASVNMYMFVGSTNWGFLNGANLNNDRVDNSGYQPDTTSYDYDAPLTENGDYTVKYVMVKELLRKYNPVKTRLPQAPTITFRKQYPSANVSQQLLLDGILDNVQTTLESGSLLPMELLPFNNFSGQSYGYIVYRKTLDISANSELRIAGHVCDTVTVLVNGILLSKPLTEIKDLNGFGYWRISNASMTLGPRDLQNASLDLVVENWGRNGFGFLNQFNQYKGLWQGGVYLNDEELKDWKILSLDFKKSWTNSLTGWHKIINRWAPGPSLYKTTFYVSGQLHDTFIDMQEWVKGIVIVNGFVLGRYAQIGPQQTLYLPAPFLQQGLNIIVVFEHFAPASSIKFSSKPIYKTAEN